MITKLAQFKNTKAPYLVHIYKFATQRKEIESILYYGAVFKRFFDCCI